MSQPAPQELLSAFLADAGRRGEGVAIATLLDDASVRSLDAVTCSRLAEAVLRAGYAAAALALLDGAIRRDPDSIELHYQRGNALRVLGQPQSAEEELRWTVKRNPAHRDAAYSLAHLLREEARTRDAGEVMVALANARQADRDVLVAVLQFLIESDGYVDANDLAARATSQFPRDAAVRTLAGTIALALGEFARAREHFHVALDADPTQGAAWLRLAHCQRYVRDDEDIVKFRSAWTSANLPRSPRICAGFALGKALDDLGDFSEAARIYREANALAADDAKWDTDAWLRFVDAQVTAPTLPQVTTDPGFVPVFIVGLPRSGTTLLANQLTRHAGVRDAGELAWIPAMHARLQQLDRLRDANALDQVARLIAAHMRRQQAPVPAWIIDKNPLNFRYLNFVGALFPNARVLHFRRNPRDVALSIWQQHFAHADLAFSYRFDSIAQFFLGHERLMRHWNSTTNLPCLEVPYENVVGNTASELVRVTEFLHLPATGRESAPSGRGIATASAWQARQAIHARSVGRWRHYAAELPELEEFFPGAG
jgi:tetratricopeptide (TPR) repeat protein